MTAKRKIMDKNGVQVFPITHTRAVLDDNGNSVEERLQENLDLINQKQLEVGAVPSDTTPTEGSTNWVTSGGVYSGLQNIRESISALEDVTGLAGRWTNRLLTNYVTFELDESGHNGTWHILKKYIQSAAIRMNLSQLTNGKIYHISFNVQMENGLDLCPISGSVDDVSGLVDVRDYYSKQPVIIRSGQVSIDVEKVSDWNYLYLRYGIYGNLTYPLDVVISDFNISEVVALKDIVEKSLSDVQESVGSISDRVDGISNDLYGGDVEVPIVLNVGTFWNSQSTVAVLNDFYSYYSGEPVIIENDTDYKIEIVTASSTKTNPILIVDENYTILKKLPRGTDHTSVTTFNIAQEDFPVGSKFILLTGVSSTRNNTKVYKIREGVNDKIPKLQQDVDDINKVISHLKNEGRFDFTGTNIAIIGDSISTNGNYDTGNPLGNVPEIIVQTEDIGVELSAYVTYYDIGVTVGGHTITSEDVGTELTFIPVSGDEGKIIGKPKNNNSAATEVWWEVAMDALGFNPIPVSWSGSSITSHEGNSEDLKTSYAWHPAQIRKCGIRTPGTMTRTAPDMIIIYRGTNDFSHSPYTRLTDFLNVYPVSIPESDTFDDSGTTRYGYLEGLAITVNKLREAYPEAQIVVCTFNYFHRVSSGQPSRNGINTIYQYNDAIRAFANYFGCGLIEFDKDGITYANAASGAYYNEGTSPTANHTHPNTKGHKVMGNRAIVDLQKINSMD